MGDALTPSVPVLSRLALSLLWVTAHSCLCLTSSLVAPSHVQYYVYEMLYRASLEGSDFSSV